MNRTTRILTSVALAVASSAVVVGSAQPAAAVDTHSFCNAKTSIGPMYVAFYKGAPLRAVQPGRCGYGDWLYVPVGRSNVSFSTRKGPGWNDYTGHFTSDSLIVTR